ncbi:hypothetical protein NORO109296_03960 [Nocardiopsis rhodophaea]
MASLIGVVVQRPWCIAPQLWVSTSLDAPTATLKVWTPSTVRLWTLADWVHALVAVTWTHVPAEVSSHMPGRRSPASTHSCNSGTQNG